MAIAERELKQPNVLTYENYLAEGVTPGRYEIVDGIRYWMTSTHDFHQDIAQNIFALFRLYQKRAGITRAYFAPLDILTQVSPLKVRQPDVMMISTERYGGRRPFDPAPWTIAPELAVEIISRSESKRQIAAKLAEYSSVEVHEAWLIYPMTRTIDQWQLAQSKEPKLLETYREGQMLKSIAFADLEIVVSSVFEL